MYVKYLSINKYCLVCGNKDDKEGNVLEWLPCDWEGAILVLPVNKNAARET